MLLKIFLLFTILPVVELYVLFKMAAHMGFFETLAIVIITGFVGAWLAKQQGFIVVKRLQEELVNRRPPGNSIVDGVLVLIAGIVLLTPGIITDLFGIFLLIPPTRVVVREAIKKYIKRKMAAGKINIRRY